MPDIIHLLPDSIANQIAAGEVVQRPASVVKELLENALDARATRISLIVKDGGNSLIQVIDNGVGMSPTDARMAFEKHATSKIENIDDLFRLHTMGFRGEALASIAAVAQVELRTRAQDGDLGTCICIAGSRVERQESITCEQGCNITVKNLFFNVPARRRFLKKNDIEKRFVMEEWERVTLAHPDIEFTLISNDTPVSILKPGTVKQRIVAVMGKSFNQQLVPLGCDTQLVKISGFVSKPENARKGRPQQFFFVNDRYMRHPYFAKAVLEAFKNLLQPGESPNFFIYFELDAAAIDVNVHPAKTEIKFADEAAIWQFLFVAVRDAISRVSEVPVIDFNPDQGVHIPVDDPSKNVSVPKVAFTNPFAPAGGHYGKSASARNWEALYAASASLKEDTQQQPDLASPADDCFVEQYISSNYQYKNRYLLTPIKSGMAVIDQRRAHIRILFDRILQNMQQQKGNSQRLLFPEIIELSPAEQSMFAYIADDLTAVGFDMAFLGNGAYSINATPEGTEKQNAGQLLRYIISQSMETGSDLKDEIQTAVALSLARTMAVQQGAPLPAEEITAIIDRLFASANPNYTPDGKAIFAVIGDDYFEKLLR